MSFTCLLADDEPLLRFHLQELLEELWPELEQIHSVANGNEAWEALNTQTPDIVFLDIKMPGLSGLEVAQKMQAAQLSKKPLLVFLTAYDQHAVEAFEREAIDYLLKPIDPQRLATTIQRLRHHLEQQQPQWIDLNQLHQWMNHQAAGQTPKQPSYLKWIKALKGDEVYVLDTAQILAFQAEDKYTTLITSAGQYLIRSSLKQLEQELDPDQFWRIHRRTLVQVAQIEKVTRQLNGQLRVRMQACPQDFPVSRRFAERFRQN